MNRTYLAQQVPALMSGHPLMAWQVRNLAATPELIVDLWLHQEPKRRGQVVFDPKWELFTSKVLGHESIHPDEPGADGVAALRSAIERTHRALIGPTEVTVTYAAGVVVRSSMSTDFGDVPWSSTRHPGRRLRGLLRGNLRTKTVAEYWPHFEPPG